MEKKFRVFDKEKNEHFNPTQYVLDNKNCKLIHCDIEGAAILDDGTLILCDETGNFEYLSSERFIIEYFTGLKDKNGVEIYEGDNIMIRTPYRSTQTHTGDNIPMGSYTEPMEAEIEEVTEEVRFSDGCFNLGYYEGDCPKLLSNYKIIYTLEDIKECISYYGLKFEWQEELEYLLETYKLNSEEELLQYLGLEIISNIHQPKQEG